MDVHGWEYVLRAQTQAGKEDSDQPLTRPELPSSEVVAQLHMLIHLREKMEDIQSKIEEVTVRLEQSVLAGTDEPSSPDGPSPSAALLRQKQLILTSLRELDNLLGQPDLITRDDLRSHIRDLRSGSRLRRSPDARRIALATRRKHIAESGGMLIAGAYAAADSARVE